MPLVSANFQADFSKFAAAVDGAEAKMKNFETGAKSVTDSMTRMENSISGVKIVQAATIAAEAVERLGGVSRLTYDELQRLGATAQQAVDKMAALGQTAPAGVQALADHARGAAEEMLRLQNAAEKTGDGFSQWASKLDFKGAITDPMNAAKQGVLSLAESFGPEGVLAVKVVAGVAAAATALIHLGNEAEAVGRSIGKMGTMFNIPVEAVSDLRFAITAAGGDFDGFGDSMFMFQKRIEDNGDVVKKGVEKIGLSFDTLKNLRPDEQLLAISDAMRAAGNDVNKSAVAFEIFGRAGKDMLPLVMKPLSDLNDKSKEIGATWSQDDVQAARDFGKATTILAAETEEAWTSLGRTVAPVTNELVLAWDTLKLKFAEGVKMPFEGWADMFALVKGALGENALADERMNAVLDTSNRLFAEATREGVALADQATHVASKMLELGYSQENVARVTGLTTDKVRELSGELKGAKTAAEQYNDAWAHITELESQGVPTITALSQATKDYVIHLQDLGAEAPEIARATGVTIEQQKLLTDEHRKGVDAATKFGNAWVELNSIGTSYQSTVDGINPKLRDQATYYLEAGASVSTLAAAFPALTDAQAEALDETVKMSKKFQEEFDKNEVTIEENTKKQTEKINESILAANAVIMKASSEAKDFQMKNSMDTTSYQVMKIWETADAQVAAFKGTAEQSKQYAEVVFGHAADMQAKIEEDAYGHMKNLTEVLVVDVVAVANKIKGIADDTVSQVRRATQQLQSLQGGVKLQGTSIDTTAMGKYLTLPNGQRVEIGPHGELPDNLDALMRGQSNFSSGTSDQPRIGTGYNPPQFGEGGVGDFGSGTLAMLHGLEAIVPLDRVPASVGVAPLPSLPASVEGVARQSAAPVVLTINITQPLGTPAQIADVVGRAIMTNLRGQGVRVPASE